MKKIKAILKGCKFTDKLFGLREKEINRKLDAAKDKCEEQKIKGQLAYEEALNRLGDDNVFYEDVINSMIRAKQDILEAEDTLKAIDEIIKDLNSDVKVEEEGQK